MRRDLRTLLALSIGLSACDPGTASPADAGDRPDATSGMDAGRADAGLVDGGPPAMDAGPAPVDACPADVCWETSGPSVGCGTTSFAEDFSSQRYGVHALRTRVVADRPVELALRATGGAWSPALLVGRPGEPALFDGEHAADDGDLSVAATGSGRGGDPAQLTLTSRRDQDLVLYVTSWATVDAGFAADVRPPADATYGLTATATCTGGHVAPAGAIAGEVLAGEGDVTVDVGGADWGTPARVDAVAGEHIGFRLTLPSEGAVEMALFMWDGAAPVRMRLTDFGDGRAVRMLATRDPDGDRTFWVRARGRAGGATLTVTRTPLSEDPTCSVGCDDLLQLPLPIDREAQGYDSDGAATFIYQFGRRALLQAILFAGRRMVAAGYRPFTLKDLSRPDGSTPPDHMTHTGGFHADVSLYDASGVALWGAACASGSSTCSAGDFGAEPLTYAIATFFSASPVSTIYLDCAYHGAVCDTATSGPDASRIGDREREILCRPVGLPCPTPTMTLTRPPAYPFRHVPSHEHHFHIRTDGY